MWRASPSLDMSAGPRTQGALVSEGLMDEFGAVTSSQHPYLRWKPADPVLIMLKTAQMFPNILIEVASMRELTLLRRTPRSDQILPQETIPLGLHIPIVIPLPQVSLNPVFAHQSN